MKRTTCPKQGLKLIRRKYSNGNDLLDSLGCMVPSVGSDPARLRYEMELVDAARGFFFFFSFRCDALQGIII